MRKSYRSYSLLTLGTLGGVFLVGSCSIIAEVDRTKIPQDGGTTPEGGQGTGGSSGSSGSSGRGGSSGEAGNGGTSGTSGMAGDGGMGGEPVTGGTGGTGATDGGMGGETPGGMGGEGGMTPTAECGNGEIENGEECDDDGVIDGNGCDSDCQEEPGWTCSGEPSTCAPICGDGIDVGAAEVCDDGNSLACGTCAGNAGGTAVGCAATVTPAVAAGSVTPVTAAMLDDGTTFTIDDGYNPAITFEFDSDSSVTDTATLIGIDYTAGTSDADLQTAIIAAINGVTTSLLVTATAGTAPAVTLTHDRASSLGNEPITVGGPNAGADVAFTGMAGGLAGNCPATTPCVADADCASLDCASNLCTP